MADYYVYTQNLSVGYPKKTVLENIAIGVNRGEILTLIGPNGAGKSTVLKSIAGQLKLIAGTVYIDKTDRSLISKKVLSQKLSVVFTQRLRTELMTCRDVVATGRYPYTGRFGILCAKDRQKVEEAMALIRITAFADEDFAKISDGQRQRVMLARAICQEPDIILLDEPTSYLDIRHKLEFLQLLQNMAREKKLSVIMSLHELDLAKKISDRIICVGEHCVERFGTPQEIFRENYMKTLFGVTTGSFDETTCGMELEMPKGEPKVFVLAGAASGQETFRRLQRRGVAFATGILFENDMDYPVAKALAAKLVNVKATQRIGMERLASAKELASKCESVICCREHFADWEPENRELYEYLQRKPSYRG